MARKRGARAALEAEVKHAHRLAGQKVSRIAQQGVNKKEIDPRRPINNIGEMSTHELKRYRDTLNTFRARKTQYVAGARGKAIPADRFKVLKALESEFNQRARQYEANVGNIRVPGTGRDIAANVDARKKAKFTPTGQRRMFEELNRKASGLTGPEAVEDFIKQMKKQLSGNYFNQRMKTQRDNIRQMLETTGDSDVWNKIKRLTNNQLNVLIDYSYFMTAVGGRYAYAKATNAEDKPNQSDSEWFSSENEDNRKRMDELIDWAKTLPKRGVTNRVEYGNLNVGQFNAQFNANNPHPNAGPIPTQRGGKRNRGSK